MGRKTDRDRPLRDLRAGSGRLARFAKAKKTLSATTVAATSLSMSVHALASYSDVTAITTQQTTGASTVQGGLPGVGASYSPFTPSKTYSMHYLGEDDAIQTVTAGGLGTYTLSSLGTVTVRRSFIGGNDDTFWYAGSGSGANNSTVTLDGPVVSGLNQALSSNNLLMGADNIFANLGNAVGDDTNVDRVDVLFNGGITTSTSTAVSIFDRGPSNDHDSFQIAPILSLDSSGLPASYGQLLPFNDGTWGATNVVPTQQENIVRQDDTVPGSMLQPSDSTDQAIGGVLIQTSSLAPAGTKIYGYSLFSADVDGAGDELVDWTNTEFFPPADDTSTGGGLDPAATLSALYTSTSTVPEPASGALAMLALAGSMARRPVKRDN